MPWTLLHVFWLTTGLAGFYMGKPSLFAVLRPPDSRMGPRVSPIGPTRFHENVCLSMAKQAPIPLEGALPPNLKPVMYTGPTIHGIPVEDMCASFSLVSQGPIYGRINITIYALGVGAKMYTWSMLRPPATRDVTVWPLLYAMDIKDIASTSDCRCRNDPRLHDRKKVNLDWNRYSRYC
jgi:hypothetical protein